MHRNSPNRHDFAFYVCLNVALGCLIAGAVWFLLN
jgi:uncharacterized membrane protein YccC